MGEISVIAFGCCLATLFGVTLGFAFLQLQAKAND